MTRHLTILAATLAIAVASLYAYGGFAWLAMFFAALSGFTAGFGATRESHARDSQRISRPPAVSSVMPIRMRMHDRKDVA